MTLRDFLPPIFYKMSAATRAIVMLVTPGQPIGTSRNYAQLSREGYEKCLTVYACVNEMARAIGGFSWILEKRRGEKRTEIFESPLLSLVRKPNPREAGGFFFEKLTGYLMLAGNSYIERVGPTRGAPRELYSLRPDRVEVIPDRVNLIGGYRYRAGGEKQDFDPALICHLRFWHPTDDWYGLSPISVAATTVDTDNAAQAWNFALLKNSGRPSGALVVSGNLQDDQFKRLKAMMEEEIQGSSRAGLPLLLEGGMDWKEMGVSPKDMDFINARGMSKLDIAMALTGAPELIGLKEATFENRREARRSFYLQRVLPLGDSIRDELNLWLTPLFGDNLYLDYDRDAIDALQDDREKVWARVEKANYLTINEKREAIGYDTRPEGDVLLVPFNLLPLGGADTGQSFTDLQNQTQGGKSLKGEPEPFDDPARERLWKGLVRQTLSLEKEYARAIGRFFRLQQDVVLHHLEAYLAAQPPRQAAAAGPDDSKAAQEILFELEAETGKLREVSKPYFERALEQGGTAVWTELGAAGAFGADAATAQIRITSQLNGVRSIVASARARVAAAIEAGLNAEGGAEPIAQIAGRVRDVYDALSAHQAATISRTETARAYSDGRDEAMDRLGVEETEWLSARDEHVRADPYNHRIDGQKRRRDVAFSNGLFYPHDPAGEAGNVINCRCVALPVVSAA